ncbi:hypothetical protein OROMI_011069 [Orobanche minor]
MGKSPTIDFFFKRKHAENVEDNVSGPLNVESSSVKEDGGRAKKLPRYETIEFDISDLERDPGLRIPISKYPVDKRDEVRRAYCKVYYVKKYLVPPKYNPGFVPAYINVRK